jgi:hypothetical protein
MTNRVPSAAAEDEQLICEVVDEAQLAWDYMKPFLNRVARRMSELVAEKRQRDLVIEDLRRQLATTKQGPLS